MLSYLKLKLAMVAYESGCSCVNQAVGMQHDNNHMDSADAPEQGNFAKQ